MNIIFLHRDFPSQFKYLVLALAGNPQNNVFFICENDKVEIKGVTKFVIKPPKKDLNAVHPYLKFYEQNIAYAEEARKIFKKLKKDGIKPDVIYAFNFWGLDMFAKDVFPDVPLLLYTEWYYNAEGADLGFDGQQINEDERALIRCKTASLLPGLTASNACVAPTQWQKNQFPKEYHNKIFVIHDGIDTETCSPDSNAKLVVNGKNLELDVNDEVITYGTRGMEPYRGFPQFMEAAQKLLKRRPNAHIVIAGVDDAFYGPKLSKETYKEYMLKKLKLDMSRVHFVGSLSFYDYVKLLQISSAHVYLTFPFILSWSILNAMSVGCCVVASNTAPVLEVIQDNHNGLLFDFFNVDQLVEKVEYALENQDKMQVIRNNARQTVLDNYDVRKMLVKQVTLLTNLVRM